MLSYARDDTHYLLYIYDKMRLELWERGSEHPTQLRVVWQRSRDICLKVRPLSAWVLVLHFVPYTSEKSQMF